jgi:hypothetical protein
MISGNARPSRAKMCRHIAAKRLSQSEEMVTIYYFTFRGNNMSAKHLPALESELHEVKGAVDILDLLREEFEQWLEEAQDDSKTEALENVLGHIEVLDVEYRRRQERIQKQLKAGK